MRVGTILRNRKWALMSLGVAAFTCGNASGYEPIWDQIESLLIPTRSAESSSVGQTRAELIKKHIEGGQAPPVATSPSILSEITWPELGGILAAAGPGNPNNTTPPKRGVDGYPLPQRISWTQGFGRGIGAPGGYADLQMFFAPNYPGRFVMPFAQLGGYRFYSPSYWGAALGGGVRFLPGSTPLIIGGNSFYNYGETNYRGIHELGLGLELIGLRWGLWVNGYAPLNGKLHQRRSHFTYPGGFTASVTQFSSAFAGVEVLASGMIYQKGLFLVNVWGGPYALSAGRIPTFWGYQFAIQPQYRDYLSVFFGVSHDSVFGTLLQGGISFSLPLYNFSSLKGQKTSSGFDNWQVYQPVRRFKTLPERGGCCWKRNW